MEKRILTGVRIRENHKIRRKTEEKR